MMSHIYWSAFSWEAFATLAAGFMAVFGATWVGLKQVKILARQVEILNRQARLEELKLKSDLFDKRVAIYQATRAYLDKIFSYPTNNIHELRRSFLADVDKSRFLFKPEVLIKLSEVADRSRDLLVLKQTMQKRFESIGIYGAPEDLRKEIDEVDWLSEVSFHIGELFGDELLLWSSHT